MEIKIFNSKIAGFLKIRVIIKTKKSKRNDKKSHGRNGYIWNKKNIRELIIDTIEHNYDN